ncbi:hypothetical protein HPB50_000495 [Hyalomma asiaticum]|uniref:Uncharacterized protein n=1 Tax=Hyalomma asiaticum TaxID=266040 RepID=A0ACB7RL48_HYAAI|nr:hypothetical protein HPB50_000495 [Hyalomma asiaticum]
MIQRYPPRADVVGTDVTRRRPSVAIVGEPNLERANGAARQGGGPPSYTSRVFTTHRDPGPRQTSFFIVPGSSSIGREINTTTSEPRRQEPRAVALVLPPHAQPTRRDDRCSPQNREEREPILTASQR